MWAKDKARDIYYRMHKEKLDALWKSTLAEIMTKAHYVGKANFTFPDTVAVSEVTWVYRRLHEEGFWCELVNDRCLTVEWLF
jgi:hypothetical protein